MTDLNMLDYQAKETLSHKIYSILVAAKFDKKEIDDFMIEQSIIHIDKVAAAIADHSEKEKIGYLYTALIISFAKWLTEMRKNEQQ